MQRAKDKINLEESFDSRPTHIDGIDDYEMALEEIKMRNGFAGLNKWPVSELINLKRIADAAGHSILVDVKANRILIGGKIMGTEPMYMSLEAYIAYRQFRSPEQ